MDKFEIASLLQKYGKEIYRLCGEELVEKVYAYYNTLTDYTTIYAIVYDDVNEKVLDCYKFYGHAGKGEEYALRKDYPYYLGEREQNL